MAKRYGKKPPRTRGRQLTRQIRDHFDGDEDDLDDLVETWIEPPPPTKSAPASAPADEAGDDAQPEPPGTRDGIVVGLESGLCWVDDDGESILCVLPSRIAQNQRASIAVGDEVRYAPHDTETFRVLSVAPRRSELSRPDPHNPRERRVLAANIDIIVHIGSVVVPPVRPALIDRFLIIAARGGASLLVWINKVDLLDTEGRNELESVLAPYRALDVPILLGSTLDATTIETLRQRLAGKTAVFAGHSGVGKSSLLRALAPNLDIAIGAVSTAWGKGRHTTTSSSLYRLADDTKVIDTPGIRELGIDVDPAALDMYFDDIAAFATRCRFRDCRHIDEPGCAVLEAVANGELSQARYDAYLRIRASLETAEGSS
ncbi:MAG: ribosome small subunit-dependent GTPase A [Acidobacteriota bacterium]